MPLPVADGRRRRPRRNAAGNRERMLDAARARCAADGVAGTRMVVVARDAGVGVGTLYRAFSDKSGLAAAVLDGQEHAIQDAVLRGEPPLGPGAPPHERALAFLDTLAAFVEQNTEALLVVENGTVGARYRSGAYAAWRLHLSPLLAEARPALDATWHAEALLAPLAADLVHQQRTVLGVLPQQIRAGLRAQLEALLG